MYGGGLRSLIDLGPAAFIGMLFRTVPLFADRTVQDQHIAGFMPALNQALGVPLEAGHDNVLRIQEFSQCGRL